MSKPKQNGAIAWEGNSLLDGSPIALILTGLHIPSSNIKTGDQIQSWILPQNILPSAAVMTGEDKGTCGNCPLRRSVCYVQTSTLNNIWHKYRRGGYLPLDQKMLRRINRKHQQIRITAYGEATAIPIEAWQSLFDATSSNTGFTHQWRNCDQRWQQFLMASIETPQDLAEAQGMGWRTFRPLMSEADLLPTERLCSNYLDEDITCEDCGLCSGTSGKGDTNIANPVHGLPWKLTSFKALIQN